ncbi:hypothetical protein LX64_03228 [Chitinophaga skermanii]|uniref:Uncharacterized protein n=1 Tax=Chitinophaga skermanii TaxID=331697 RepID=A0A327QCE0_9BACT|nr:hypothetical protein [Chitinophaga skermanii]RAJ02219.1 hypothetical protein LX64_03228 [Chitinophaga skermanii]
MIQLNEVKVGDWVLARYEEQLKEGTVTQVDHELRQACLQQGDAEYWYSPEDLSPIPLNEEQLVRLQFQRDDSGGDAGRKYVRGPFSVVMYDAPHHPLLSLHYRDETRNLNEPIMVHQLQNHYHGMTNWQLD